MINFLARRLLSGVVLILVITTITYALIYSNAANAARNILGESATAADVAAKAKELGLDRPLHVQYLDWLSNAIHGDFGVSWFTNEPVSSLLANRLPVTLSIVIFAVLMTAFVSAVLGVTAAVRGGWVDRLLQVVSVIGFSLPNFWVALVLVVLLAVVVPIFPATGYVPATESLSGWFLALILPVTALVLGGIASAAQQIRGAVIDVLDMDYVRTLRARGLSSTSVLLKHVLRNAAPPALTILSLQFIALLGGAVVIERVFAIPGMGTLTINSSLQGDIPALMGVVVALVILVVIVNLVIDLANGWINPKARLQ
ncbi:ABC transporter permease [Arthrobacter sp. SLBN-112]|uniref:ABC transporter permease n=1 Tax=Arthrobacter sp. SLBN-112 TaxID=2768452 RepID=UPI0027B0F647|nr:ABC transporter permease [Arthrobacter sp. SLBN-112]MDQ0801453.1 peptide/nickel transport system permease protein [Arthrobacter sp. SLBN-112]